MVFTLRPLNSRPQPPTSLTLDSIYIILSSTGVSKATSCSRVVQLQTSKQYTEKRTCKIHVLNWRTHLQSCQDCASGFYHSAVQLKAKFVDDRDPAFFQVGCCDYWIKKCIGTFLTQVTVSYHITEDATRKFETSYNLYFADIVDSSRRFTRYTKNEIHWRFLLCARHPRHCLCYVFNIR